MKEPKYKHRPTSSRATLPPPRTMSQAEAERKLRRQVFIDATDAGILRPVCIKKNALRPAKIYALADVEAVEDLILSGIYPGEGAR